VLHYLFVVIANACALPPWDPQAGWWDEAAEDESDDGKER
jgi:hypothetical protein